MTPPLMIVSGSSRVRTAAPLNHALYAEQHGLPYFFDAAPSTVDRIYFHKVHVIRRYLPLADWLLWMDDDAFFTDFRVDPRTFVAESAEAELVFCKSPINPRGGWTWMNAGVFFIRNTSAMTALIEAVLDTELAEVKAWWDPDAYGLFTNGDQDAFVYQLQRPDARWKGRFVQLQPDAFNNRPYHYDQRLDEHFVCHFALPGAQRRKSDVVGEFAERLGTNQALCPAELFEPYREFLEHSDMGVLLGMVPADAPRPPTAPRKRRGPVRRAARAVRSVLGR